MNITYTSKDYKLNGSYKRYVRLDGNGIYYFCEVNYGRYDVRQGTVNENELPSDIAESAQALQGYFPSYVDWPYE